jgi:hypothetical protein
MKRLVLAVFGFVLAGAWALGQGVQTGEITGTVKLQDGTAAPGVSVTLESPALQGKRVQVTGPNGSYIFKFLPAGQYTVTFELQGMKPVVQSAKVEIAAQTRADATLTVSTEVAVTVTGTAIEVDKTAVHESNYDDRQVQALPVGRTLDQIAAMAPAVTTNTPDAGQLRINGGFAYDNVFLLDGVDIDDHYFSNPTNQLYIEDAVQETHVLSSNISAEYGRFTGGVVNAITKSGGNDYHGSFRTDFTNDRWRARTPFENDSANDVPEAPNKVNEVYSATVGGRVVQDRLWFFLAGRYFDTSTQQVLPITAATFQEKDKEPRIDGKLTGNIADSHTITFGYTYSKDEQNRVAFPFTIDPNAQEFPSFPTNLLVARYNGVITPSFFVSGQYSEKKFEFKNSGGTSTNIVDSPMICATLNLCEFNAPYFDATDPEHRNNRQFAASLNYFLAGDKLGSHDIKLGGEAFRTTEVGGNSQSATNYVFFSDYLINAQGKPIYDAGGRLMPVFQPGVTLLLNWLPIRGATGQLNTNSIFLNDSVKLGRLSANLGVRYEHVDGTGPTGAPLTKTHAIVPRVGASYDVLGDGKYALSGSYAEYSGGANPNNFLRATNVGTPNLIYSVYTGPAGSGRNFAPGFDPANYQQVGGSFPTENVFNQSNLSAPITREYTFSAGGQVLQDTYAAVTYINRATRNFVDDFVTIDGGKTDVVVGGIDYGTFDNIYFKNTNVPKREYQAIAFQSRSRIVKDLHLDVNYTYMIKYFGDYEGESTGQPAIPSLIGNNPEIYVPERNFPLGNLSGLQRHKLRLLSDYTLPTSFGIWGFGLIYAFDSGTPYSYVATGFPVSAVQLSHDPGYANPPATEPLYFGQRGSQTFPSQSRFDLALNYEYPIAKVVSLWVKGAVVNVFNTHYLLAYNTAIVPCSNPNSARQQAAGCTNFTLDSNGLPTTFVPGAAFGTARSAADYQVARTFTLSAGIRF